MPELLSLALVAESLRVKCFCLAPSCLKALVCVCVTEMVCRVFSSGDQGCVAVLHCERFGFRSGFDPGVSRMNARCLID